MGILYWIVFGLIAGFAAKRFMPDKENDPGGMFVMILIGVAGAFVGGMVATFLGIGTVTGFDLGSFVVAVAGAVMLLYVYNKMESHS